ncbi:AAA family ATPase [Pandoraea thiooxydans]|uniref:AAA family ATPase n=1 Tax=Pandoraea thiooxydans TaxID=445709 RepID=A0A0G3EUP8_9BURK|nr:AAA family ATPase [Pandoraea thiooxydans]AKJ69057.1 AAA family ATPase [Pandoraea thiooxydans]
MKPRYARPLQGIRLLAILASLAGLFTQLPGVAHAGALQQATLLGSTVAAAALIWLPNPRVRGWNWTAFLVLWLGAGPLVWEWSFFSIPAALLLADASRRLWRLHRSAAVPRIEIVGTQVWIPVVMKIRPSVPMADAADASALYAPANPVEHSALAERPEPVTPKTPVTPAAPTGPVPRPAPAAPPAAPPAKPVAAPTAQPVAQPASPVYDFSDNVSQPRYTFADVVGMRSTKKRLWGAAQDIIEAQGKPRNGILLFGEPGNGKTLFAEALAGQLGIPFLSIAYGDAASKWINETPQKVKAVFAAARKIGTCVLFIDEIDSFIKSRGDLTYAMDRDLTNVMLTEIVALRGSRVILVAATNWLDALDAAGKRDGRFDFKIEIPAPDLKARLALLYRAIVDELGVEAIDRSALQALAGRWEGFSAARLSALGGQLREMRRDGLFAGPVTFEVGMRAMRLLQGRRGQLPENVKAIEEIILPDASRDLLSDLAFKMEQLEDLEQLGASLPRGLIFTGPPGTGKTQAAMALAKASGWAFLKLTGAQIIADPSAWDKLYREACDIRPAIVFIDEADGILQDRRVTNYGMLTEKILTTMDGAGGRMRDVMFIAATNYYERIDSAALRGGRFEEKVVFDVPGPEAMADYVYTALDKKLGDRWQVSSEVVNLLTERVTGRSIADADAVIEKTLAAAALRRIRDRTTDIRVADVEAGVRAVVVA